jgi:O-antigen/teichoic acid export membrane protein
MNSQRINKVILKTQEEDRPVLAISKGEGIWSLVGQFVIAIAFFLELKVLTTVTTPAVFGSFKLLIGVVTLVQSSLFVPFIQSTSRFFQEAIVSGHFYYFWRVQRDVLRKTFAGVFAASIIGFGVASLFYQIDFILLILALSYLLLDASKAQELAYLTASKNQKNFALWTAINQVSKLVCTIGLVLLFSGNVSYLFAGYVAGSLLSYCIGKKILAMPPLGAPETSVKSLLKSQESAILVYSYPLIAVAILAWIAAQGDRYVLAKLLDLKTVGIYAGTYGLVSSVHLMLSEAISRPIKPHFNIAVVHGDGNLVKHTFKVWAALVLTTNLVLVITFAFVSRSIFSICLSHKYLEGASWAPYISLGYGFLCVAYLIEAYFYAFKKTKVIFFTTVVSSLLSMAVFIPFIYWRGALGASQATAIYFFVHLGISFLLYKRMRLTL